MSASPASGSRSCRPRGSMIGPRGNVRCGGAFAKVPMPLWENCPPTEGRMHASLISILTVGTAALLAVAGFAAPGLAPLYADNSATAVPVDVELVLAVDVSYSMDPDEQALQREGYIAGFTSREFMQALRSGQHGKVAVTYFEWAGPYDQKIVVPWRLIDGPEGADAFVKEIGPAPSCRASRTPISAPLGFSKPLSDRHRPPRFPTPP